MNNVVKHLSTYSEEVGGVVITCTTSHPRHGGYEPTLSKELHITKLIDEEYKRLNEDKSWRKYQRGLTSRVKR